MQRILDNFKSYLEKIQITPISWLVGISGVLMVRFFIEAFSNKTSTGFFSSDSSTLIHYSLFFLCIFIAHLIIFDWVMPKWKNVIPQFVAATSLFIFIAPVIDWIMSGGQGFKMTYIFSFSKEAILNFFNFAVNYPNMGATPGLRLEIILMLLFFVGLVHFVQKSWKKTTLSFLALLVPVLFFPTLPLIISTISQTGNIFQNSTIEFFLNTVANSSTISNNLHGSLEYSSATRLFEIAFNFMMSKILFLILIGLSAIWFYKNFKNKFKALIGDFRSTRTIHYFLTVFLGMFAAWVMFPSIKLNWNDWLSVIMMCLSFYFSIRFAVCVNDIVDEDVDKISNTDRPLVAGSLSKENMKQAAVVFVSASIISGFLAGYTTLFFVLAFTALYYIYSATPTRFKLIPFFSSFLIGLCSLSIFVASFYLISPLKYVSVFPDKLLFAIVLIFFLHSHIRDIKDIEGDKAAGIKTVPVLFGDKWGIRIVGYLSSLAFILVPLFVGAHVLFWVAIPAVVANYYFVTRKPFVEKYVFYVYFIFVFLSFLILFF